jgi:hypothetical protein
MAWMRLKMTVSARVLAGLALLAIVIAQFCDSAVAAPCTAAAGCAHAAPGPIVGAGLPILAIGLGAYWLVGRLRRKPG